MASGTTVRARRLVKLVFPISVQSPAKPYGPMVTS